LKPHRLTVLLIAVLAIAGLVDHAGALPAGIQIVDTEMVLRDRTRTLNDGLLYLEDEEGTLRRFVTSTSDPLVLNPGDGQFHPLPSRMVQSTLEGVDRSFIEKLGFGVYILPYPVAEPMSSWAGDRAIYLSPGVYDLQDEQVHFVVSHEVGHLVHRAFLPDSDRDGWAEYCALRGIDDSNRFNESAIHRDRPHEIFAEDFRVLFGAPDGTEVPPIENTDLIAPDQVPGLRRFFLHLIGAVPTVQPALAAVRVYPNPLAAGDLLRISLPGSGSTGEPIVAIYDLAGRQVRSLRSLQATGGGNYETRWDGGDDAGRTLPHGVYFCRVRSGSIVAKVSLQLVP
jgi:hypothetical protein